MIPHLTYSRLGRMIEVYDLIEDEEVRAVPPDAMFLMAPNVISLARGWVHVSAKTVWDGWVDGIKVHRRVDWDMQVPLTRWLDLTIDITQTNDDRDVVVD